MDALPPVRPWLKLDFIDDCARTDAGVCIFDWSDVVLGHPFFACDRLLDACWSDAVRKATIVDACLAAWRDLASLDTLRAEFAACQKLRVLYEGLRWTDEIAGLPEGCRSASGCVPARR